VDFPDVFVSSCLLRASSLHSVAFHRPFSPASGEKVADPGAPGDEGAWESGIESFRFPLFVPPQPTFQ